MVVSATAAPPAAVGKVFPGTGNDIEFLNLKNWRVPAQGHTGRIQDARNATGVVFFRFPRHTQNIEISIYDPGSAGSHEVKRMRPKPTQFTLYGGIGAHTGSASRGAQPGTNHPGSVLASGTYLANGTKEWVTFGPFQATQGEIIDGYTYFKLVAHAKGTMDNLFATAAHPDTAEAFFYSVAIRLKRGNFDVPTFYVEVPPGLNAITEHNSGMRTTGTPRIVVGDETRLLNVSRSRNINRIPVIRSTRSQRLRYDIAQGEKQHGGCSFYFTDDQDQALKVFFEPASIKTPAPPWTHVVKRAPEPKTVVTRNACEIDTNLVHIVKRMPVQTGIYELFDVDIEIAALKDCADVLVTDAVPSGARFIRSEPRSLTYDGVLSWQFAKLKRGDIERVRVTLRAEQEGLLQGCATVVSIPSGTVSTRVREPKIGVSISGPKQVTVGEQVSYEILVNNPGTATVKNVVVIDQVPAGMAHPNGKILRRELGNLPPNATKSLSIFLRATHDGQQCNRVTVESGNVGNTEKSMCTQVMPPPLQLTAKNGDPGKTGETITREFFLDNHSETALTQILVTATAAPETVIVDAIGAIITGNVATWRLPELQPGMRQPLPVGLVAMTAGKRCIQVTAVCAQSGQDTIETCDEWKD
jgi:uncharacterized repeat protein (TIGR01451 family)